MLGLKNGICWGENIRLFDNKSISLNIQKALPNCFGRGFCVDWI